MLCAAIYRNANYKETIGHSNQPWRRRRRRRRVFIFSARVIASRGRFRFYACLAGKLHANACKYV